MSTWSQVRKGDVIQARKEPYDAWEVLGVTGDRSYTVTNGSKTHTLRQPSGEVVILLSREAAMERATALVQVHLGGRVHAVQDSEEHDTWRVPVEYLHPGELHAHLYVLHGTSLDVNLPFRDMVKTHADAHHPEVKARGWVEHIHDPNFRDYLPGRAKV
jgi:hypothetical protein